MSVKQQMLEVIEKLPDDTSVDEAIERLYLLNKINTGLAQVESGQIVSHEEMKRHFKVDEYGCPYSPEELAQLHQETDGRPLPEILKDFQAT